MKIEKFKKIEGTFNLYREFQIKFEKGANALSLRLHDYTSHLGRPL